MIRVKNEINEKPVIEILGDIGEGWFDEGVTSKSINEQIRNISGDFDIVVSSLGGYVDEGFAIHDLIKMHKGTVTAKIISMTASAGTVVALAADKVEMSENALFLVHNACTMAMGNANDLQKTIDDLNMIDGRLAGIYAKKTGKRKSQILSLMEEERWLDANEAKEWGFADKIFTPATPVAMNSIIKKINDSNLPKINKSINMDTNEQKSLFAKFKAWLKDEEKEEKQIDNTVFDAKALEIESSMNAVIAENETLNAEKSTFEAEKERLNNLVVTATEEQNQAIKDKETALSEKETIKAEFTEYAKAKLDRVQCEKLGVEDFSFIDGDGTATTERTKEILNKKPISIKNAD